MKYYIFDLDNTLIFTDSLNNESYNYALTKLKLSPIKTDKRITRSIVFKKYQNLTNDDKNNLIKIKQNYFITHIQKTIPNTHLLNTLQNNKKEQCILWTNCEKTRAIALLKYYQLNNCFAHIVYYDKNNIQESVDKILKLCNCNLLNIEIYDDNINIINYIKLKKD
ncbi:MAG: HAD hydrolase-like protein [Clostridia bacterium]|nr:HAD hydrolase-like protein [Clostridia bacterium]